LAEGIVNIINLLAPEAILLGGGVCNEGEYLIKPLKEAVYGKCYGGGDLPHSKILTAVLGNDAGIVGAAMLYK
jgi:glucokinase